MTTASQVNALADGIVRGRCKPELEQAAAALREYAALLAAQEAPAQGVTDGYKLVPIVPTEAMIEAGNEAAHRGGCDLWQLKREVMNAWPAMLAAAPPVDAQARENDK